MNNYSAMNICKAVMYINDDSVNVAAVGESGNVYDNVEVDGSETSDESFTNDQHAAYIAYDTTVEINVVNGTRVSIETAHCLFVGFKIVELYYG